MAGFGVAFHHAARFGIVDEADRERVFEIGNGTHPPEYRNRRRGRSQSPAFAGVAAGRVAHHGDRKIGLDRPAGIVVRGPRARDPEQSLVNKQAVRGALLLRHIRAIGAVIGSEQRIRRARNVPPFARAGRRQAHAVGRLVTRDAGAPRWSARREEGILPRIDRATGQDQPQGPGGIGVIQRRGKAAAIARLPPARRAIGRGSARGHRAQADEPGQSGDPACGHAHGDQDVKAGSPLRRTVHSGAMHRRQAGPVNVRPAASSPRNCHSSQSTATCATLPP